MWVMCTGRGGALTAHGTFRGLERRAYIEAPTLQRRTTTSHLGIAAAERNQAAAEPAPFASTTSKSVAAPAHTSRDRGAWAAMDRVKRMSVSQVSSTRV